MEKKAVKLPIGHFSIDHICLTCRYYDGKYHGGYCDKHKCDTRPGSTCNSWWESR